MTRFLGQVLALAGLIAGSASSAGAGDAGPGWATDAYLSYAAVRYQPRTSMEARPPVAHVFGYTGVTPAGLARELPFWTKSQELEMEFDFIANRPGFTVQASPDALIKYFLQEGQPFHKGTVFIAVGDFAPHMAARLCQVSRHVAVTILIDPDESTWKGDVNECLAGSGMPVYFIARDHGADPQKEEFIGRLSDAGFPVQRIEFENSGKLAPSFAAAFFETIGAPLEEVVGAVIQRETSGGLH